METASPKIIEISTSVSARILEIDVDTVLKYRKNGKLKTGRRSSSAKQAPWVFDRAEIYHLKAEIETPHLEHVRD